MTAGLPEKFFDSAHGVILAVLKMKSLPSQQKLIQRIKYRHQSDVVWDISHLLLGDVLVFFSVTQS